MRNLEMGRTIEEVFQKALRMVDESSLGFDAGRYDLECAYSGKVFTAETARTPRSEQCRRGVTGRRIMMGGAPPGLLVDCSDGHHPLWRRGGRLCINILLRNRDPQDKYITILPEGPGGASPGRTGTRRRIQSYPPLCRRRGGGSRAAACWHRNQYGRFPNKKPEHTRTHQNVPARMFL